MKKVKIIPGENTNIMCTLLFAAFMLLQLITLRMANGAGGGYLSAEWQNRVYLFIQLIVVVGIMCHVALYRLIAAKTGYGGVIAALSVLCAAFAEVMLFMPAGSAAYLAVSGAAVLCLGFVCGAVYLKISELIKDGARAGVCIALGYALSVALQYVFQLSRTVKPLLAAFLALSAAALAYGFLNKPSNGNTETERRSTAAPRSKLIFTAAVTFSMMVFTHFYNIYIHNLQVSTGYAEYSAYGWPRLLMIPAMLLMGLLAEIKNGRLLPVGSLCVVAVAMLNAMLGESDTYLLGMCLYYISLAAVVAYYHVTFLKTAQTTRHPELWAVMGRALDSVFVIITFIPGLSSLTGVTALALDIAALCVTVVLMALNGDLALAAQPKESDAPFDPFPAIAELYGITPGELRVLREVVLTDDKHEAIALRLGVSVSTVRHYVSSIYKKTGTQTRLALSKLVDGVQSK